MSVGEKVLGAESRWLMGRVMAGDFLEGVGNYLHLVAPDREKELGAAIRARFAALETDDPLAGYSDKIERRFTGPQESG